MLNKKGDFNATKELFLSLPKIFTVAMFFLFLIFAVDNGSKKNTDISEIESFTLKNTLFYSDCITIQENNRVIPGSIDLEKFNEDNIKNCLNNNIYGMKLSLNYKDQEKIIVINEAIEQQKVFCFDNNQLYCDNREYYIGQIEDSNNIEKGTLKIELTKLRRSTL
ncbi:hypothetical protein CL617_00835 [archaeon]|nr:hypothetical protein [archaeon]